MSDTHVIRIKTYKYLAQTVKSYVDSKHSSMTEALSGHTTASDAHSGVLEPAFTDAAQKTVSFTEASSKDAIASGDTLGGLFSKIANWFSSFGNAAWINVGTESGSVTGFALCFRKRKHF